MKKLMLAMFAAVLAFAIHGAPVLKIFGGEGHEVFLGELNTSQFSAKSIWNQFWTYGSQFNSNSIWNQFSQYGSDFSQYSPFNEFASNPPVVVDGDGNFYGYLTINETHPKRATFKLALRMYDYYKLIREDVGKWADKFGF